jgi:branched-chain amino acid transport system ATP-binding protein
MNDATLLVDGLSAGYGPLVALRDVSFSLSAGGVTAVLGANGAGKSTLGRALSGLIPAVCGSVKFGDRELTGLAPNRIARSGLVYVPEGRGIFPTLSVIENLRMAHRLAPKELTLEENLEYASELFPVLQSRKAQRAGTLSGGEQQMLALARAFCARPKLIIADELSLGLAPKVVEQVFAALTVAKTAGIGVIVIEQFVDQALAFADSALIMQRGAISWAGSTSEARTRLAHGYLGNDG